MLQLYDFLVIFCCWALMFSLGKRMRRLDINGHSHWKYSERNRANSFILQWKKLISVHHPGLPIHWHHSGQLSLARQDKDLRQHMFLGLQEISHDHPLLARHDQCLLGLAWKILTFYTCPFLFDSQLVLSLFPSQVFIHLELFTYICKATIVKLCF